MANAAPDDEIQADRLAYGEAWKTIAQQPATFAYACLVRLGRLWSPLPHRLTADESAARRWSRWAVAAWYAAEFLLAAWGVWRMAHRTPSSVRWALLLVGCVTAVHTVYWTDMRMRGPLMAAVALLAAVGATDAPGDTVIEALGKTTGGGHPQSKYSERRSSRNTVLFRHVRENG